MKAPYKVVISLTRSHLRCLLSGHFFRSRLCGPLAGEHGEAFRALAAEALEAAGTLRGSPENKGRC